MIYGRNQSGYEKAKNVGFLPFSLLVFLTIYIFAALMKIAMCFMQLEVHRCPYKDILTFLFRHRLGLY